jgi:catechol 2,3-dioxygenase-like lactoylglutathione lyase family enzyme
MPPLPTVNGIIETALYVADLHRSARFYQDLFGLRTLLQDDRLHALAVGDRQVLLLFAKGGSTQTNISPTGGLIPPHDAAGRIHVGFAIATDEIDRWEQRLREFAIDVESRVYGPRGGTSLYLRDPDGHLVELLSPGVWAVY